MKQYIINILIGIDQLLTAVVGGWPDETLSSYAYRMKKQGKPFGVMVNVIDALFFFDPDHCHGAYQSERARSQLPPEAR